MAATETDSSGPARPQAVFVTTSWSVVLTAACSDATRAQAALEHLCQIYWYPLYAFVRRRGYSSEDAKDLTQTFFYPCSKVAQSAGLTSRAAGFGPS